MSTGDNGFVLICAAFVFFMTPGLAFFYGGLVRRKNIVNTIMDCMRLFPILWCGPRRHNRRLGVYLPQWFGL